MVPLLKTRWRSPRSAVPLPKNALAVPSRGGPRTHYTHSSRSIRGTAATTTTRRSTHSSFCSSTAFMPQPHKGVQSLAVHAAVNVAENVSPTPSPKHAACVWHLTLDTQLIIHLRGEKMATPLCTKHLQKKPCTTRTASGTTRTQKPISTLETAAQTPQHKTIAPGPAAPGHTARVKADNTADHTADMSLMDFAGRMVVHSESNS